MGKESDKKEDTGFGFKDKAKALETIELLKSHDTAYQRLTVRGLLGRAKRVLTLTKAEDKLKNIKEAMAVFEDWIENYEKDNPPKSGSKSSSSSSSKKEKESKKSSSSEGEEKSDDKKEKDKPKEEAPTDSVQGLGFKDKDKALETIKILDGRDPDYQKLAIKGLVGRAKRVLTCTKDKDKVQCIKDAMEVFENFLDDFDKMNMSKKNMTYLPLSVVESCAGLAKQRGLSFGSRCDNFIAAYKSVKGEYKKLRTVVDKGSDGVTWDIVRNKELGELKKKVDDSNLFDDNGNPSKDHLKLIMWAYSSEDYKLKKLKIKEENGGDVDMKDDSKSSSNGDKKTKESESKSGSDRKRKHSESDSKSSRSSSGSESEEETPTKKKK